MPLTVIGNRPLIRINSLMWTVLNRIQSECKQLSLRASGDGAEEATKGAVLEGLIGAAIGGFGGRAKAGFETKGSFKGVFKKCMRNREHAVLD